MGFHGYDPKSCNALQKPFYRPVEAAIRWCGLIAYEAQILAALGDDRIPKTGQFPEWPCLQANTEKILDAILHEDIPHGRDGQTVPPHDHVARARLTVRHTDLRAWMSKNYPDQKPAFLFDELERSTHTAINADSYRSLQADLKACKVELERVKTRAADATRSRDELAGQCASMQAMVGKNLGTTERRTLLTIIAILCRHAKIDYRERGAAATISRMAEEAGTPVSDDTVRRWLQEIPDAVESRTRIS